MIVAVEGTDHVAADLLGNHEHSHRHQFGVGEVPDFFLQGNARAQVLEPWQRRISDRVAVTLASPRLCLLPERFQFLHGSLSAERGPRLQSCSTH